MNPVNPRVNPGAVEVHYGTPSTVPPEAYLKINNPGLEKVSYTGLSEKSTPKHFRYLPQFSILCPRLGAE